MLTKLSPMRASIFVGGILFIVTVTLGIIRLVSPPATHLQGRASNTTLNMLAPKIADRARLGSTTEAPRFVTPLNFVTLPIAR